MLLKYVLLVGIWYASYIVSIGHSLGPNEDGRGTEITLCKNNWVCIKLSPSELNAIPRQYRFFNFEIFFFLGGNITLLTYQEILSGNLPGNNMKNVVNQCIDRER